MKKSKTECCAKDTKEKVARALKSKAKESSRSRKDLDSKVLASMGQKVM